MNKSVASGEHKPESVEEKRIENGNGSKSVVIKAPSSNASDTLIGGKANLKYPLSPGEKITFNELSGMPIYAKLGTSTDKLYWISVEP